VPTPSYLSLNQMIGQILYSGQITPTSATTIYTVPASTAVKISQGTMCNTSASAVTVSLSLVPSGGTDNGTHSVVSGYSLIAGDTLPLSTYIKDVMMGPGDFISVVVSAANVIDVVITGAVSS
jgi:hypothetical protein